MLKRYPIIRAASAQIHKQGGRALVVGGAVRDLLLGIPSKDLDIEVYGLTVPQLQNVLKKYGPVSLVGKSFGVLRVHGVDVDWSLPRADSAGRKPCVVIDPNMSFSDAFVRRDLTINAMGIDIETKELIDPWGGYADLKRGALRAPEERFFKQDPLRLFRVMQFISRFDMKPDTKLNKICKSMSIKGVSRERIEQEFTKLLLKSKQPSLGIRWLESLGRLHDVFPELAATVGVAQEKSWHPEGDVFEHTMQALDAAARLSYKDDSRKLIMMYAALTHDLGKVTTSKKIDGVIRSLGHAEESATLAKKMLKRITHERDLIAAVQKLVANHMVPIQFSHNPPRPAAYKRLAAKLAPDVTLEMLGTLALVDRQGRNPKGNKPLTKKTFPDLQKFIVGSKKAQVFLEKEQPILLGRDLLSDIAPGPRLGELVKKAYQIQLDEGIKDKDTLKKRVLSE